MDKYYVNTVAVVRDEMYIVKVFKNEKLEGRISCGE